MRQAFLISANSVAMSGFTTRTGLAGDILRDGGNLSGPTILRWTGWIVGLDGL